MAVLDRLQTCTRVVLAEAVMGQVCCLLCTIHFILPGVSLVVLCWSSPDPLTFVWTNSISTVCQVPRTSDRADTNVAVRPWP